MLSWLLTGGGVLFLLVLTGGFFLLYLKGQPFLSPRRLFGVLAEPQAPGDSPIKAMFLALAGTLGVGNLVGVASAISLGGAGAVFWMWLSALFAMVLKYAEILLAVRHRRRGKRGFFGGAAYYIKDFWEARGCKKTALFVSALFSFFLILNSFCMGSMIQVRAITSCAEEVLAIPPWLSVLLLLAFTLPFILRGTREISALTAYLVPIMSLGLLLLSALLLFLRRTEIGPVFRRIFDEAFSVESAAGGVFGFLTSRAMRVGTMRGLFSNEAGCGTSPTAHATASSDSPARQGVWGIVEVFVDTILLCSLTALVILTSGVDLREGDGILLTMRAYTSVLGPWAAYFLAAALVAFGYATILCWANYGLESIRFLSRKKRWKAAYLLLYALSILSGGFLLPAWIWNLSDFAVAGLSGINLLTLFLMRREVREETERVFLPRGQFPKK